MSRNNYVSEQWLRTHVYESGKESQQEESAGSEGVVHLAEARAMLRYRRRGRCSDRSQYPLRTLTLPTWTRIGPPKARRCRETDSEDWRDCCGSVVARGVAAMSYQTIALAIDALLTDEELRIRFVIDRFGTLADLSTRGFELTSDETEALLGADVRIWFWNRDLFGARAH